MAARRRPRSCADRLRVLADETRLAILRQLSFGPKFVYELNEPLGLEQSLISHHLRVLRLSGFVISERIGKAVRYDLAERSRRTDVIELGCCRLSFG